MRKTLTFLLTLCILLLCLVGCSRYEGTFTQENSTTFTFDGFVGTHTVKLERTGLGDGQFYYRAALNAGSMAVSYKMGRLDTENPLFKADADSPLDSYGGYIWDGSIFITFTSDVPVSGKIFISFENLPKTDGCPFEWVSTEDGHSRRMLCDCCDAPAVVKPHEDQNGDMICDICGYNISLIDPPPINYFLRNQAGAEWLQEITAEDITEIKMISAASGVAPGTPKNISSSTQKAAIARLFEEYYRLDTTPVSAEDVRTPGGSILTVQFVLTDGTVKALTFDNEAYFDGKGNVYKPLYIPCFNDVPEYTSSYGFITYIGTGTIYDSNNNPVCKIPVDELEFIITGYDFSLFANGYDYYINTEFGKLYFVKFEIFTSEGDNHELVRVDYYFIVDGDTEFCYRLVGKNLDVLIEAYSNYYSVTMNDQEWLYEDLVPTYKAGETITVKINIAYDLGFLFLVNGEKVAPNNTDGQYWEFIFTMPDNDVVIDFKTYDGFLPDMNYAVLIETFWMHDLRADYVSIRKYYGEFDSGAIVAMIDSGEYPCVVWEEAVGSTIITYGDGNRILVLYNGEFYTLPEAYAAKYITEEDLAVISDLHRG